MRRTLLAITILLVAVAPASASASTCTFSPGTSDWQTSGNWDCGHVPGSSDDVVINSGTVQITGADASARSLEINTAAPQSGGLRILDHTLTVSSSGTSTLDGFLEVDGTLNLNDPTTYEGTTDSNGINIGGTLNIGSTFTMTSADDTNHAAMNNTNNGLVHVLSGGSLVRDTSTGIQTITPPVDNDGTTASSVKTGTLNLAGGDTGSTTGGYSISSGAALETHGTFESPAITGAGTLDVASGTATIGADDTFTVPTLRIDGGTVTLDQDVTIPTVVTTGGHRNGTGSLTVTGTADFSGLWLDTGTTTVAASVPSFNIDAFLDVGSTTNGTNATLNLDTPTTYTESLNSNGINLEGGVLNIASTFAMGGAGIQAGVNDTGGSPEVHVLSTGSLTRDTSTGAAAIGPTLNNSGTVSAKTGTLVLGDGLTQASGAVTTVSAGAELDGAVTLNGGSMRGNGTLGGPVVNVAGTVAPGASPGTLTITGDYTQEPGGTLAEDIAGTTPGTQFDRLLVGGAVALDGTLAINSSGFTPTASDTFKIISGASSRTGTVATVTGAVAGDRTYVPRYDTDGVTLEVGAAPPPPGGVPVSTALPAVGGHALSGSTLTCSRGAWSGGPSGFVFQWFRDGVPILGATGPTYVVRVGDENQVLSCGVIASNAHGAGKRAVSRGVHVAFPKSHCPVPSGSVSGTRLGPLALGMTQQHARALLPRFTVQRFKFDDFCLHSRFGIRAKYADSVLLKSAPVGLAARTRGRIVIALTSCGHYRLEGVKSGNSLAANARRLRVGKRYRVGKNDWYLLPFAAQADGVLKVRGDKIVEIGIADKRFLATAKAQRFFFLKFVKG